MEFTQEAALDRFVEVYRRMARNAVRAHQDKWWKNVPGVGEKTARKMLRADLESYRYAKAAAKVYPKIPDFEWRFNK